MKNKLKFSRQAFAMFLAFGFIVGTLALRTAGSQASESFSTRVEGKMIAEVSFDPATDGFGFRNYGRDHEGDDDLTAEDMIRMFGADSVCMTGATPDDCVLYEPAEEWRHEKIKTMEGGHCEGMAVSSFRLFLQKPFKGKVAPLNFQRSAKTTFELQHDETISNYIAYFHVLQFLDEVATFRAETWKKSPSELLKMLVESMKDGKPEYTISIGMREEGRYTRGHAVSPFAVDEVEEGVYRIHVYDNNYPGETKFITINTKEDTWHYHTASDPSKTANDYVGDASTQTLGLKRLSDRELPVYYCPFCPDANEQSARAHHASAPFAGIHAPLKSSPNDIGFSLDGEGQLMIISPEGKRVGYDITKKKFVKEIPEAEVIEIEGGLDKDLSPEFRLPHHKAGKPYTVNIVGKSINHEVDADMEIDGPGFVAGFQDVLLDPGESLSMTITPDGHELSFTATQDGQTPKVFISIESGHKHPSYLFEVGGIKLNAGKTVTVKLDMAKQHLYFKDNDAKKDKYDVRVVRINTDGARNYYEHHGFAIGKADNYEMDFSKWDGKGGMCFEDDEEGTDPDSNKCVDEANEAKPQPGKKAGLERKSEGGHFSLLSALLD